MTCFQTAARALLNKAGFAKHARNTHTEAGRCTGGSAGKHACAAGQKVACSDPEKLLQAGVAAICTLDLFAWHTEASFTIYTSYLC
jgi:hypothetical protein